MALYCSFSHTLSAPFAGRPLVVVNQFRPPAVQVLVLFAVQVMICDTLAELDPDHADTYRRNLAAFDADLDRVHAQIAEALAPLKGQAIFVFHPAFGYFADAYGLKQIPVEIGGKEPTARQLAGLIDRAKAAGVKVIFVQPQFSQKSAGAVAAAIDGVVVPLDDLARDYLMNLENVAAKVKVALQK